MPRAGRLSIAIPAGVIAIVPADNAASVKGLEGKLVKAMNKDMNIAAENNQVVITRPSNQEEHRTLHGLIRALINNMIIGAEKGFEKSLELVGVGYRIQLRGKKLVMNLGYSYPVEIEPIEGVTFEAPATTKVVIKGIDEEKVGTAAVDIRSWRKPGPYKGKGTKYNNEVVRRKEGKTGKK